MDKITMNEAVRKALKRLRYPIEVMLVCVRWYAAYPLSLRQIEEMMVERGVVVDHATIHRWSIKRFCCNKKNQQTLTTTGSVAPLQVRYQ